MHAFPNTTKFLDKDAYLLKPYWKVWQQLEKLHGRSHKTSYWNTHLDLANFNNSLNNKDDNLEELFVETRDLNDMGESRVLDFRPNHVMVMNMQHYVVGGQLVLWLHVIVDKEATKTLK